MTETTTEMVAVRREGAVAIVELNRPHALNAITPAMGREFLAALTEIGSDDTTGAVVLTGAGRGFCAGADLKEGGGSDQVTASGRPDTRAVLRDVYNPIIIALRELPQPVVAAVNGPAAGIGCSFALACDYVLAARSSYLLLAFVNVGLVPDGGATLLVPARAGLGRALEMSLLGERLPAEQALDWGLVNRVVDDTELAPAALELATQIANGPPEAHAAIKRILNAAVLPGLREQLELEAVLQGERSESDEAAEAILAFVQKRPASFR